MNRDYTCKDCRHWNCDKNARLLRDGDRDVVVARCKLLNEDTRALNCCDAGVKPSISVVIEKAFEEVEDIEAVTTAIALIVFGYALNGLIGWVHNLGLWLINFFSM